MSDGKGVNSKKSNIILAVLLVMLSAIAVLAGCSPQNTGTSNNLSSSNTSASTADIIPPELPFTPAPTETSQATPATPEAPEPAATVQETPPALPTAPVQQVTPPAEEETMTITVNETSKVKVSAAAFDPDGDFLSISFSEPLNAEGEWQTKVGDAGEYMITVTASDGKTTTTKKLKLVVRSLNKAPVLGKLKDLTINEGETVELKPVAVDPDGDEIAISYSGWMSGPVKSAGFSDAGEYSVSVTASDGKLSDIQTFKVIVLNVNRIPEVFPILDISAIEGDLVQIKVAASDPDADPLMFYFDTPFDENGFWQTKEGDAGAKSVKVVVSDGSAREEKTINVIVKPKNKLPVVQEIAPISVNEGEEAKFTLVASDADNDPLKLTISDLPAGARFNENTAEFKWTPDFAAVTPSEGSKLFVVKFSLSDGKEEVTSEAKITVNNVNQAPQNVTLDVIVS